MSWLIPILALLGSIDASAALEPQGQVIGTYNRGRLYRPAALSPHGPGFVHYHQDRNRHFGSQGMIELLESQAAIISDLFPEGERLQIGDISAAKGGRVSGHASHQNGLDADLIYFKMDHFENGAVREKFVTPKGRISPNFDFERNVLLLKLLVASDRVSRIFVDPVIKNALCRFVAGRPDAKEFAETLRRLRPDPNHADHLHVRLTCPSESPHCRPQKEVPAGDGCHNLTWEIDEL